jgi:hypothetical protein
MTCQCSAPLPCQCSCALTSGTTWAWQRSPPGLPASASPRSTGGGRRAGTRPPAPGCRHRLTLRQCVPQQCLTALAKCMQWHTRLCCQRCRRQRCDFSECSAQAATPPPSTGSSADSAVAEFLRTSPDAARFVRRVSGAADSTASSIGRSLMQPEQRAQQPSTPAAAVPAHVEATAAVALQQEQQQLHLLPPAQELRFIPSPPLQPRQQLQRQPPAAGRQRLVSPPPPPPPLPPGPQRQIWQQTSLASAAPAASAAKQQRFRRASGNASEPIYSSEG